MRRGYAIAPHWVLSCGLTALEDWTRRLPSRTRRVRERPIEQHILPSQRQLKPVATATVGGSKERPCGISASEALQHRHSEDEMEHERPMCRNRGNHRRSSRRGRVRETHDNSHLRHGFISMTQQPLQGMKFDEIGYWSEVKLDIVRKYAAAYTSILARKHRFSISYIDGFAGTGVHITKNTGDFVEGSPLNALKINPPFNDYYLVDLNGDKVDQLTALPEVRDRPEVHVIHGDCNRVLLEDVFPKVRFEEYRRGLCLLDPYGLHLNWEVMRKAGEMRSLEIFLNFPIMDMNRNALWHRPENASADGVARMTAFWGDESWREAAYSKHPTLFDDEVDVKLGNSEVVNAFRERLRNVAGFAHVLKPMPMRNSNNAVVYYLFFASQNPVAAKIVQDIFASYQNRRG